jgi:hypothetical protein
MPKKDRLLRGLVANAAARGPTANVGAVLIVELGIATGMHDLTGGRSASGFQSNGGLNDLDGSGLAILRASSPEDFETANISTAIPYGGSACEAP